MTMLGALDRARARGIRAETVIDLGAAAGRWTRKMLKSFPDSKYFLVEPLEERRLALDQLRQEFPSVEFVIAAAGEQVSSATLTVSSDLDGSGIYEGMAEGVEERTVQVTSIDEEVKRRKLPAPYFLKLDTHGFELPILAGAKETLKQTSAIMVEVYNFQISPRCLRFHEMCAHLEALGFRCADLADPMLRELDSLLWQFDLLFLPSDSACFARDSFQ